MKPEIDNTLTNGPSIRLRYRPGTSKVLGVFLSLGAVACQAGNRTPKAPPVDDPWNAAVQASEGEEWTKAAYYWNEVLSGPEGDNAEAYREAAFALRKMGDSERAAEVLQRGLDAEPNNPDLLELKAESLVDLGFRRSAEAYYERCLEQDPNRISALCGLGKLRLALDREMAATKPLQRAYDLGCDDPLLFEHLARAYHNSGEPIRAWHLFIDRMGRAPQPSPDLVAEAAVIALDPRLLAKHPDATAVALVWLESSMREHPEHTVVFFQHGVLSESLENHEDAIASYLHCAKTDPDFLPALTNLALLFAELEHEGPCREMVSRAVELESDRQRRRALQQLLARFE